MTQDKYSEIKSPGTHRNGQWDACPESTNKWYEHVLCAGSTPRVKRLKAKFARCHHYETVREVKSNSERILRYVLGAQWSLLGRSAVWECSYMIQRFGDWCDINPWWLQNGKQRTHLPMCQKKKRAFTISAILPRTWIHIFFSTAKVTSNVTAFRNRY
jgi:hypothetical protein